MIFIDTSIWISYFRKKDPSLNEKLDSLLDQAEIALAIPVQIELLFGTRKNELASLKRVLLALPVIYPTQNSWLILENWILKTIQGKEQFGFADLLIAAIAAENKGQIWSLDHDFKRMEKLNLIQLYKA